jgi:predicted porin
MNFTNFLDSKMRLPNKVEYSRKVTYYTPEYKGIQIGISYIPDSANVGYSEIKDTAIKHKPIYADYYYAVKNGFAGGITYNGKIADLGIKLAAVGEMGKVIATPKAMNEDADTKPPKAEAKLPTKFRKLKNYTIGAQVEYKDLSLAASYGDYMRSFTCEKDTDPSTEIYGFGAAYKFDKLKTSITYFGSTHRKNAISATTLAVDYKLAPGLLPYAEVTTFNAKGRHVGKDETKKSHKGFLVLTGAKIEF